MNYTLYLAIKYLKPQKDKFFSYLSLFIAVLGIAVGVCTLIVTMGVMNGFHKEIKARLSSIYPHIIITPYDYQQMNGIKEKIENNKSVELSSAFLYSQAILKNKDRVYTCIVKAIDYEKEKKIVNLSRIIKTSSDNFSLKENEIIVGRELAKNLDIVIDDEVVMILPTQIMTPFGNLPLTEKFVVKGFISSGVFEYDNSMCLIDYNTAMKLFYDKQNKKIEGVVALGVKIKDDRNLEKITLNLKKNLVPKAKVYSWVELNYNLFAALKLEKVMMVIIVSLIIIVACFIIVSNLLLKGLQKSKDIGILKAIGVKESSIQKIFFIQGMFLNLSGIFLGMFLGFFLGFLIKKYQFIKLPKDIYYIDKIPVYFSLPDITLAVLIAILVGIFASIYPAKKISQFDPVEIIRYG